MTSITEQETNLPITDGTNLACLGQFPPDAGDHFESWEKSVQQKFQVGGLLDKDFKRSIGLDLTQEH